MTSKRGCGEAFKREALPLREMGGKTAAELERVLEITPGLVNNWKARCGINPVSDCPDSCSHFAPHEHGNIVPFEVVAAVVGQVDALDLEAKLAIEADRAKIGAARLNDDHL